MSKNLILFIILSLLLVSLESSLSTKIVSIKYFPDLSVILICYITLYSNPVTGLTLSFILGLIQDLSTGVYLGPNAFGAAISSVSIKYISKNIFSDQIISTSIIIFISSFLKSVASLFLVYTFNRSGENDIFSIVNILIKAVSSAIVGGLIIKLLTSFLGRSLKSNRKNRK